MTKAHYEQSPAASDGAFYSISPRLYDANGMDCSAAGAATGQPSPGASTTNEVDVAYPPGWDYSMLDDQMTYPPLSPDPAQGGGDVSESQSPWNNGVQAYSTLTDTTMGDALAMCNPMPQYLSVEQPGMTESMSHHGAAKEPTDGWYDSLDWPHPPHMGRFSPSPSQNSYHPSSPASGAGAHHSRQSSCLSPPAARVAALEQTGFDARCRPVPGQAISPDEERLTPGRLEKGSVSSHARQTVGQLGAPRRQTMTTTTTTDHVAGTLSPALMPSPRDPDTTISSHSTVKSAHKPSDQRASTTNKGKEKPPAPARRTSKQKQAGSGGQQQGQQQKQQQHPEAAPQAKGQAEHQKKVTVGRRRNRDAAIKCRAKKKKATADLESAERAMSSEHRELSAVARGLREEVIMLKNEVLAHGGCDDALIQQYLTKQARRVGLGP